MDERHAAVDGGWRMIAFTAGAWRAMRRHAEEGYPHEVVGVLAGKGRRVLRVARLTNERRDRPHDRYAVSGLALAEVEIGLEDAGLEILGTYHSHPDLSAVYSEHDRDHAWHGQSYVIVGVEQGVVQDVRCWTLRADRSGMDAEPLTWEG